jgi:hypothetical protein
MKMSLHKVCGLAALIVLVGASACGGSHDGSGSDGGTVPGSDGGTTAGHDGGTSAGNDGGTSPGNDSGTTPGGDSSAPGPDGSTSAPGLHAVMGTGGNPGHIADGNGKVVVLHGADESGTENYCTTWGPPPIVISPEGGPSPLTQDSLTAMKSWGLNIVRIPLNEDCWLGINGVDPSVGGANYQKPILDAVNLITKTNGMYAILDLHWAAPGNSVPTVQGAMPDLDHTVTFWQQVATAYRDNGSVVFDLFNEPQMSSGTPDDQFKCWANGSTAASSGDCPMVGFAVAGMTQLLATVRQAGATNLVIMGGTGYSSQLGLWAKYVPTDTLSPPNIAASWHVYDDQGGCTDTAATSVGTLCGASGLGADAVMTAGYPILVGETGYYSCPQAVGQAWWPIFLSWADAQGIGYVAWSWSDGNNPQLLANTTSFTPGAIGPTYQTYLKCIATKTVTPASSCTFVPTTGCE